MNLKRVLLVGALLLAMVYATVFGQTQTPVNGRTIDKDNSNTGVKTELTFYPHNGETKTITTDNQGYFKNSVTGIEKITGEHHAKTNSTPYTSILNTHLEGKATFTLFDIKGSEIEKKEVEGNSGLTTINTNLSKYANGIYIFTISDEKGIQSGKINSFGGYISHGALHLKNAPVYNSNITNGRLGKIGNIEGVIFDSVVVKGSKGEKTVLKDVTSGQLGNIPTEVYETINMTELMYWQQPDSSAIKNQDITFTGPITKTLKTDNNGKIITNLPAGTYTITTDPQKIWTPPNTTFSTAGKTGLDTLIYVIEYKGLDIDNIEIDPHTKKMSKSEMKLMQITHTDDNDNNRIYKLPIDPTNVSGTVPTWYLDISKPLIQQTQQIQIDGIKYDYQFQKSPRYPNGWGEPKITTGTTPPAWFTAQHKNILVMDTKDILPEGYIAANYVRKEDNPPLINYGLISFLSNITIEKLKFARPHEVKSVIEGAQNRADGVTINGKYYPIKSILNDSYRTKTEILYFKTDEKISTLHNYLLSGTSIKLPY